MKFSNGSYEMTVKNSGQTASSGIILSWFTLFANYTTNSLLASSDFCSLLLTFANSLDSDQDRQKYLWLLFTIYSEILQYLF